MVLIIQGTNAHLILVCILYFWETNHSKFRSLKQQLLSIGWHIGLVQLDRYSPVRTQGFSCYYSYVVT